MRESVQVEIASELAIDAHEQVAVECRGDAERVVVREQQFRAPASPDPRQSAARRRGGRPRESRGAVRRLPARSKLPMFEPRKSTSVAAGGRSCRPHGCQAGFVGRLVRDDRHVRSSARASAIACSSASAETSTRCTVSVRATRARATISVASFSPLPGPSSTTADDAVRRPRRSPGVRCEQALLGARDAIPRQRGRSPRTAPSRARRRGSATAAAAACSVR